MTYDPDDDLELEVTLTFPVPAPLRRDLGPREAATHVRDMWVDDPDQFVDVVTRAIGGDDYVLQVKPFSEF